MVLESNQYDVYEIPVPEEVERVEVQEYVLRQTEKRHPCFDEQYRADIELSGWGRKRKARVTVVADEVLMAVLAEQGEHAVITVPEPGKHRVFSAGAVHQLHRRYHRGLALAFAALVIAAVLVVLFPVKEHTVNGEEKLREETELLADMPEGAGLLPDSTWIVGTIFGDDGGKTVFYRDESGKLKSLSVFAN